MVYIKGDSQQAECISRLCDNLPEEAKGQLFCQLQVPEQVRAEEEFLYIQVQGIGFLKIMFSLLKCAHCQAQAELKESSV